MKRRIYLGGTFDLCHSGHINLFKKAKEMGYVIVSLNTDEFNEKYKGKKPIMSLEERMEVIKSCKYVDKVIVNTGGADSKPAILKAKPDHILHGSDWVGGSLIKQMGLTDEFLKENKISMITTQYTKDISTTDLINRIRKGPKNIAIDVDETLCDGIAWTPEDCLRMKPIKKNKDIVNQLYQRNFIIIYTARRDELIKNTIKWLKQNGIMFHAISNNKIPAYYYVDDRSISFNEIRKELL